MSKWGGSASRRARKADALKLGLPCPRCGRPVLPRPWLPHDGWQSDHWPIPRELGGVHTLPAHSDCNLSAGGRRGAQLTNQRKRTRKRTNKPAAESSRNIRGI